MNLNANGLNKTFKTGTEAKAPYYYLTGSLDLSGCSLGTYYFNSDNDFSYANDPIYRRFISVDENVVLSEVTVYSNPPLAVEGEIDLLVRIGGAANTTTSPVVVNWAAPAGNAPVLPPGYSGAPLTVAQVNSGSVNYYGHEGGHFPYYTDDSSAEDLSEGYRFLAITLEEDEGKAVDEPDQKALLQEGKSLSDLIGRARLSAQPKRKGKGPFRQFPSGNSVISEGRVTVVLKVYPKDQ